MDRMLNLEGIPNIRDLGGIRTTDGKTVRSGALLRSGKLQNATDASIKVLKDKYRLKLVMDFRMSFEIELSPNPVIEGVEDIRLPIFDETKEIGSMKMPPITENFLSKPENLEYAIHFFDVTGADGRLYINMLEDPVGQAGYGMFLKRLAQNKDRDGMLWHCSYGKDRTGIAAALILSLLGVSRADIMDDFVITNSVYKKDIEESKAVLHKYIQDTQKADIIALMLKGAAAFVMEKLLDHFDANYGSTIGFAKEKLGVDDEMIDTLKNLYLV